MNLKLEVNGVCLWKLSRMDMAELNENLQTASGQTSALTEMLATADRNQLAKWWCELNNWGWPDVFGEPEPKSAPSPNRREFLICKIMDIIGYQECLREWNKDTMPGEAFDDWFSTIGIGC